MAVGRDRMTHGWFDHWFSNRATYCKRAAWAWEIEQAAWRPTTISLRDVTLSLERGQLRVYDLFQTYTGREQQSTTRSTPEKNSLGRELIALPCSASTGQGSPGAAMRTTAMRAMRNDGQLH